MDCCCNCHRVDIVAISIPENMLKDRYEALIMADKIMKHNKQDKHYIRVQENWTNFIIYYESLLDLKNIKIKKFDNDISLFLRLPI